MDYLNTIFKDVKIPKLTKIQQTFDKYHIEDIDKAVKDTIAASDLAKRIKPGDTVAIGGGSRGVTDIHKITRAIVNEVKVLGAKPFIVPVCGSHGNAIAEGHPQNSSVIP